MFSTRSHDNDISSGNCADACKTGWWFMNCRYVLLFAPYGKYPDVAQYKGIVWLGSWGEVKYAKFARMMVRPN